MTTYTDVQRTAINNLHTMVKDAFDLTSDAERVSHAALGDAAPDLPNALVLAMENLDAVRKALKHVLDTGNLA